MLPCWTYRLTLSYKIKGALQVLQRQKWGPEIFQYQSTYRPDIGPVYT